MRRSYVGVDNPFYGKTHSQESIEKMREYRLGKFPWNKGLKGVQPCSEETRQKLKEAGTGRIQSDETIEKCRIANLGIKNPNWKNGITADKEYWLQYCNTYRAKKRTLLLDFLGGKCVRCGFTDYRALQIDHIDGGGLKELKEIGNHGVYKNAYIHPEKYQVLCANCNWIKKVENKENANMYARKGIIAEKKLDVDIK
jgi:hypothetical protein